MKKPNGFTLFIGNPLVAFIFVAVFAYTLYQASTAQGSVAAASIMAVLAVMASNAFKKANDYFHWQREWNIVGGQAPRQNPFANKPLAQIILAAIVFNSIMFVGANIVGEGAKPALTGWWWLFNLALIGVAIFKLKKSGAGRVKHNAKSKEPSVTVCLPIPKLSMDFRQTYAVLPEYCRTK